jgi:hypothetical protein
MSAFIREKVFLGIAWRMAKSGDEARGIATSLHLKFGQRKMLRVLRGTGMRFEKEPPHLASILAAADRDSRAGNSVGSTRQWTSGGAFTCPESPGLKGLHASTLRSTEYDASTKSHAEFVIEKRLCLFIRQAHAFALGWCFLLHNYLCKLRGD